MTVATPSDLEASFALLQREARSRYRSWPAADVDDALQEAMEELLRRPREIDSTLKSYVLVAVRNRLLNTTRGVKSIALNAPEAQEQIERDAIDTSEDIVHQQQIASIVQHALRHDLTNEEASVLRLILANEDPKRNVGEDRVARALGKSRTHARKLIERLGDKLRVLLAGRLDESALEQVPCSSPEGVSLVTAYAMLFWPTSSPRYARAVAHLSSCRPCRQRAEQVRAGMRHGAMLPGPVALGMLERIYGPLDALEPRDAIGDVLDRVTGVFAAVRRQIAEWLGTSKVAVTNQVAQNASLLPAIRPGAAISSGLVVCIGAVCVTTGVIPTPDIATGNHPTEQERRLDAPAEEDRAGPRAPEASGSWSNFASNPLPTSATPPTRGEHGERIAVARRTPKATAKVERTRSRRTSSATRTPRARYRAPAPVVGGGDPSDPLSGGGYAGTGRSGGGSGGSGGSGGGSTTAGGNPVDTLSSTGDSGGGGSQEQSSGGGGGAGGDPTDPLSSD